MSILFPYIFIISIVIGIITNKAEDISNSIISETQNAVELFLIIMGGMAFWGGIMKIIERSGFAKVMQKVFKPILMLLFRNLKEDGEAVNTIIMNVTSNILGLGNASTPLGIKAVREIIKEQKSEENITKELASFMILNTSSIQIIPVTVATLRQKYGSVSPFDIAPCILIVSLISLTVGLLTIKLLYLSKRKTQ